MDYQIPITSITPENYVVIRGDDGTSIITNEHGQLYVQHKESGDLFTTNITEDICKSFGFILPTDESFVNGETNDTSLHEDESLDGEIATTPIETGEIDLPVNKGSKFLWSNNATLALISLFKDNYANFYSTTGKKDVTWTQVAKEMCKQGFSVSVLQCKDKFQYLKRCYMKKADNMNANKNSGAAAVHFAYFEQMDEIFGKKPNVRPEHVASSSRKHESTEAEASIRPRKRMRREDKENIRNATHQKRHEERMAISHEAIATFKSAFEELKNLIKKDVTKKP